MARISRCPTEPWTNVDQNRPVSHHTFKLIITHSLTDMVLAVPSWTTSRGVVMIYDITIAHKIKLLLRNGITILD